MAMAGSSNANNVNAKKEWVPFDEMIPWMRDMKLKLINIGATAFDRENLEESYIEYFEEFIKLFEKNMMTKYRSSKRENRRTRLATYLRDLIAKLNLSTFILEKESKKRLVNYFGLLFKMYIELVSQSSMSRKLGNELMIQNIEFLAKNLFHEDIDVILDVYIVAIIPKEFKNSLMLNSLSENLYFSATCASFFKYLVVAKLLKEEFSLDKSTINKINNILSSSKTTIPKGFENYLKSRVSIPSLHSSMITDLVQIVQKIDSAGACEECLLRFYFDYEYEPVNPFPEETGGYFVSTTPYTYLLDNNSEDSNQTQEVIEATMEENNDNNDNEEVINLRPLFNTTISSDKNEMAENVAEDCTATSFEIKKENIEGSDSPNVEIMGEKAASLVSDDDDDESVNSELSNIPNYDTTDSEEDVNKSVDETMNEESVEESKGKDIEDGENDGELESTIEDPESLHHETTVSLGEDLNENVDEIVNEENIEEPAGEDSDEESTIEDSDSPNDETADGSEESTEEDITKSVDETMNEENVEELTGENSDEDEESTIEDSDEIEEEATIEKIEKVATNNKVNKSEEEEGRQMKTKPAVANRNKKDENVQQGTSDVRLRPISLYQLRTKKIYANPNSKVVKRKLEDKGHIAEADKTKMMTRTRAKITPTADTNPNGKVAKRMLDDLEDKGHVAKAGKTKMMARTRAKTPTPDTKKPSIPINTKVKEIPHKTDTNTNTASNPKKATKRKLDDLEDQGHVEEAEKTKMTTRAKPADIKKTPINPKVKVVLPQKIKTTLNVKAKTVPPPPKNKSPANSTKAKKVPSKINPTLNKGKNAEKPSQDKLEISGRVTRSKAKTKVSTFSS